MRRFFLHRGKEIFLSLFFLPWAALPFSADSVRIELHSTLAPHLFLRHTVLDSSETKRERYYVWRATEKAEIRYESLSQIDAFLQLGYRGAGALIQDHNLDMGTMLGSMELFGFKTGVTLKNLPRPAGVICRPYLGGGTHFDALNDRWLWNSEGRIFVGGDLLDLSLFGLREEAAGSLSLDYFAAKDDPIHIVQYRNEFGADVSARWLFDSTKAAAGLIRRGPLQGPGLQLGFSSRAVYGRIEMSHTFSGFQMAADFTLERGHDTAIVFANPETSGGLTDLWGRATGAHTDLRGRLIMACRESNWSFEAEGSFTGIDLAHGAIDPRFIVSPLAQLVQGALGSYQWVFSGPLIDSLRLYGAGLGITKEWDLTRGRIYAGNQFYGFYPEWKFDYDKVPLESFLFHGEPESQNLEDKIEAVFHGKLCLGLESTFSTRVPSFRIELEQVYPIYVMYVKDEAGPGPGGAATPDEKWRGWGGTKLTLRLGLRPFYH